MNAAAVLTEVAPAKLNLALHVRARRADGYHELETLFVFARDGDLLTLVPADAPSFVVTGPFGAMLGAGDDNLVLRAERAFGRAFGIATPHAITLDKRLPIASGIGGGSADAAATLRALARCHGVAVNDPALVGIAADLGADVPPCLRGAAAFGSGRGDALVPIAGLGDMPALLINPLVAVSTAAAFGAWDGIDRGAIVAGETLTRAQAGRNDLQPHAEALAPAIREVSAELRQAGGATFLRMSGSGATCFALYDTLHARDSAAATIAARRPGWWQLATTIA